ncbi:sigma-54-dependent transcriptional regulator [Thermodesulfatator autotrophicus]|uniref:Fis family transcriptional regulator n=1 Tax=Thermodesulfatator autotrophicus TaxID=1795632 RepID=A0A177E4W4_9BACT|nr:sigma-54 dependent transcriptional regulator [Thermodesulfatator autotrophicus]OAG26945.1 Fis family transcriptional regulator [Thermodesulfatator autotrophicus]
MKGTILIVDDEKDLLEGLKRLIEPELDCTVFTAENGRKALEILEQQDIDLILTDIRMPEMDGFSLLKEVKKLHPDITIVIITAYGTIEQAVRAVKEGAYDFIQKPFEDEQLLHVLKKGLERGRLIRENKRLQSQLGDKVFENFVGQSARLKKVIETIRMVAPTDVTVLILGESGTGKELAARAVHALSRRKNQPLITVNCPALPEPILESELFGYRKGAFTNATTDHRGLFEEAHGGTIFLDEIGDITPSVQTKLLRVLQEKEIKPLGSSQTKKVDVRIIASTNQNLEEKVKEGSFRADLFYRLNVVTIEMPPLREIKEDIPLLVNHFLKKTAEELGMPPKYICPEVIDFFMEYHWPGNIRELENVIKAAVVTSPSDIISLENIPLAQKKGFSPKFLIEKDPSVDIDFSLPYKVLKEKVLSNFTVAYVKQLLEKTRGNITRAAEISGIKRQSLQKILKRYGLDPANFR